MIDLTNMQYFHSTINAEFDNIMLESMEADSENMLKCFNANYILREVTGDQTLSQKIQNLIERIKEFFKKTVTTFTNKIKEFLDRDQKWLDANTAKFGSIDYDGLIIEAIPFWNEPVADIDKRLDDIIKQIDKLPMTDQGLQKSIAEYDSVENMRIFSDYRKNNESLKEGLLRVFKTGKNGRLETTRLSGAQLKSMCTNEFIPYALDYHKNGAARIRKRANDIDTALKQVHRLIQQKESQNKGLGETWSLIEGTTLANTDLRYCQNASILFEADDQGNKDDKVKTNAVTVTDTTKTEDAVNEKHSDKSLDELTYVRYMTECAQLAVGCAMNAMEERYTVYMKILHQILDARAPKQRNQAADTNDQNKK